MNEPLQKIVNLLNGQAALADVLKTPEKPISQAHVWKWLNTTKEGIPAIHVIKACDAVNYQVTPHELRPDLYPHPEDGLPDSLRKSLPVACAGGVDVHGHLQSPTSPLIA